MMKIKLSDVNNASDRKYKFVFDVSASEFDFSTQDYRIDGIIKVSGTAENMGMDYHVYGDIKCHRQFICDRCLEKTAEFQNHTFDEIYKKDQSEEIENVNSVSDDFIDITDLVRDAIITGQPISNVCRPGCKGLCPKCGTNLNESNCSCDRTVTDVRLMVLKKLLKNS